MVRRLFGLIFGLSLQLACSIPAVLKTQKKVDTGQKSNEDLNVVSNWCNFSEQQKKLRYAKPSVSTLDQCQSKINTASCKNGIIEFSDPDYVYPYCSTFPAISVEIPPENLAIIKVARAYAIRYGVIRQNKDWETEATVIYEGNRYPAEIRLKGDWTDHVKGQVWSMKFKLKEGKHILGMNRFSIQAPYVRDANQVFYNKLMQNEGVLTGRYSYINYTFDNEFKGLVAIEENFSYELVENLQQRESLIFTMDENAHGVGFSKVLQKNYCEVNNCEPVKSTFRYFKVYRQGHVLEKASLAAQMDRAIGTFEGFYSGHFSSEETFDLKKIAKYFAITDLFRAYHGSATHQMKYYYNAFTKLIEPIAHDGGHFNAVRYPYVFKAFQSPSFINMYHDELVNLNHRLKYGTLATDLFNMQKELKGSIIGNVNEKVAGMTLKRTFSKDSQLADAKQLIINVEDAIERHKARMNSLIDESNLADNVTNPSELCSNNDFVLFPLIPLYWQEDGHTVFKLHNAMDRCRLDIESIAMKTDEGYKNIKDLNLSIDPRATQMVHLDPAYGVANKFKVMVKYKTNMDTESVKAVRYAQVIKNRWETAPSLEQFLTANPMFSVDGHSLWLEGTHKFTEHVVLPKGYDLQVAPNSQLYFGKDVRMLIRGALIAVASKQQPILFSSIDSEGWGGIELVQGSTKTSLNHVTVENVQTSPEKGVGITGAVSIYESSISVSNSVFQNIVAEDGLNIVRSSFSVSDSTFVNLSSDAIDTDFSNGDFSYNTFEAVLGDAIDISGSKVNIHNISFKNITDKAMSIGEASNATIWSVDAKQIGIGIAVKDQSHAIIRDSNISDAQQYAILAYMKKDQYKPCHLVTSNLNIDGNQETMIQAPCTMSVSN